MLHCKPVNGNSSMKQCGCVFQCEPDCSHHGVIIHVKIFFVCSV